RRSAARAAQGSGRLLVDPGRGRAHGTPAACRNGQDRQAAAARNPARWRVGRRRDECPGQQASERMNDERTLRLDNRVAIVTGAGGGLGRWHALALARRGAKVVVNDLDAASAERVAMEIRRAGGAAIGVRASVTDPEAVAAMVGQAIGEWG